jgi:hypothetical protein
VGTVALQADDEGEVTGCSGGSANDGDGVLRRGSSGDGRGQKTGYKGFELHGSRASERVVSVERSISEWMSLQSRRQQLSLYTSSPRLEDQRRQPQPSSLVFSICPQGCQAGLSLLYLPV